MTGMRIAASSHRSIPAIFRLPLELRRAIYAELLPCENVSHPLPSVGITAVSHRLPPAALLLVHPTITHEVLDYYYAMSTWKLIFSHAFNFFRTDPELKKLEQSASLARIRQAELVFFCDVLLLRDYPSFGIDSFCQEIERRASRACDVLLGATNLRHVTVSWIDTTDTGRWPEKAKILRPLRKLGEHASAERRQPIAFGVGEVSGSDDVDCAAFEGALWQVLAAEGEVAPGSQPTIDSTQEETHEVVRCIHHRSPDLTDSKTPILLR